MSADEILIDFDESTTTITTIITNSNNNNNNNNHNTNMNLEQINNTLFECISNTNNNNNSGKDILISTNNNNLIIVDDNNDDIYIEPYKLNLDNNHQQEQQIVNLQDSLVIDKENLNNQDLLETIPNLTNTSSMNTSKYNSDLDDADLFNENNRTALFLDKMNARITSNLNKSTTGLLSNNYEVSNNENDLKKNVESTTTTETTSDKQIENDVDNESLTNVVTTTTTTTTITNSVFDTNDCSPSNNNVPEDNVERLRNIRDMFENSDNSDEQIQLQKVEKLQPSEKIKDRFTNNIMDELINDFGESNKQSYSANYDCHNHHENSNNNSINDEHLCSSTTTNSSSSPNNSSRSQSPLANDEHKPVVHSSPVSSFQTNNVGKNLHGHRFEEGVVENETGETVEKKTQREKIAVSVDLSSVKTKFEKGEETSEESAAPKPVRSITPPRDTKTEIENQPLERSADVVSVFDKKEEITPESGIARSRKEMFQQIASTTPGKDAPARVKSITPPREEARKLKEKTPEKNENVIRESDRNDEAMPTAGTAKATAAIFTTSRTKSIERSGITIEGELAEKGIAKSRLALFNNISSTPNSKDTSVNESDDVKVAKESGVAKERLSLFKNLEQQQQRSSPPKDANGKRLKEFTPPPQLEPHQLQQRQYIIIDKEPNTNDASKEYKNEEYIPESGLAKNRMKQYLETATTATTNGKHETATNGTPEKSDVLPEKGTAKSLLAKWKSIENIKDTNGETSSTALQVASEISQLRKERQPTPPSTETNGSTVKETEFLPQSGTAKSLLSKWQNIDKDGEPTNGERKAPRQITPPLEENLIEKGFAKNAMASYESQPAESNINAQYISEEIIPSAGLAKSLKSKFQTLEKESAKVETSSAKLNYTPKRFTKQTSGGTNGTAHTQHQAATNGASISDKCVVCSKTVYAMEKIEADKKVYHKLCFKCTLCNCTLKLGNFSSIKDKLYCTPHFLQLFARNGNYDEGFGLENYKRKWINRTDHQATTTASS